MSLSTANPLEPTTPDAVAPAVGMIDAIDAALPQTQCTRCGYPDCRSYATAIAIEAAPINQCPPGGMEGIVRLARIVGRPVLPLNPNNGHEGPRQLAVIDENWCIGCTLCLKACPVDCIVGGPKAMHTVIAPLCTGCELCIPVCPVDCISLIDVTTGRSGWDAWSPEQANEARSRYLAHRSRIERNAVDRSERVAAKAQALQITAIELAEPDTLDAKAAAVAAAVARARARKSP